MLSHDTSLYILECVVFRDVIYFKICADLYALTRYVDAKDWTNGTNDEQYLLPRNEPGAVTNLVVNAAFGNEDDEETRPVKPSSKTRRSFWVLR